MMAPTTIFCFTGTGNSLKVAQDVAAGLPDAEILRISQKNMLQAGAVHGGAVGIVFPVYYAGLPHMVRRFVEQLELDKTCYVFGIATYGGMPGVAFDQLRDCIENKGMKLSAAWGILMPGNCQVLYSPTSDAAQQERFRGEQELAADIALRITAHEECPPKRTNIVTRNIFRLLYSRLKPKERARHFHTDEKCTGCGTCAHVCPAQNITIVDKKPVWDDQCEFCLACMQWCPVTAIQYGNKTQKRGRYHHPDIKVHELFQD